jgi:hypothetical protein
MRIFYDNLIDYAGVLAYAATQNDAFPVINTINAQRTRVYRCADTQAQERIMFDLGSAKSVTSVILLSHTILNTAVIKLEGNTSAGAIGTDWSSPPLSRTLTWSSGPIVDVFGSASYRYWRVTVLKASAATTFDLGRVFLGPYIAPTDPPDFNGFSEAPQELTDRQRSQGGQIWAAKEASFRKLDLDFSMIPQAQKDQFTTLADTVGLATPFIVQVDQAGSGVVGEAVYARLFKRPAFHAAGYDSEIKWDTTLELEEAL